MYDIIILTEIIVKWEIKYFEENYSNKVCGTDSCIMAVDIYNLH